MGGLWEKSQKCSERWRSSDCLSSDHTQYHQAPRQGGGGANTWVDGGRILPLFLRLLPLVNTDSSNDRPPTVRSTDYSAEQVAFAALFALALMGLQMWPGTSELLRFSRPSFEDGSVWQVVTSQWVHLSNWHAAGNVLAFVAIAFASAFWIRWPLQLLALGGGYAGVAIVLALDTSCNYYAGASGALHGLLAGNAVSLACASGTASSPPSHRARLAAYLVLSVLILKLWLQTSNPWGASLPANGWSFPVYHPAHIAGALGGVVLVLMALAARSLATAKVHPQP